MPKIPVKAARVAAKLTQEEMAKKLDITPSWYNIIENDPSQMKMYIYYAILYITGFSADDVFSPEESKKT
jgi:DNA-binding XRE family transcriptional regulator